MAFGTGESVLFMEVSLIQRCPGREVPLYTCTYTGEEGVSMREKLEQGIGTKEDELRAVMESLELQKKVLHDTNGKLLVSESELERVKSELQVSWSL